MFHLLRRTLPMLALVGAVACGDDDDSPFPTIDEANPIADGEIIPIAGNTNSYQLYSIVVPTGATELLVTTSGGTGDPDIYLARGRAPTPEDFDDFSDEVGPTDEISWTNPQAGTWYILVHGFQTYTGVTLIAEISP